MRKYSRGENNIEPNAGAECEGIILPKFFYSLFFGLQARENIRAQIFVNTCVRTRIKRGIGKKLKRGVYIFI